MPQPLSCVEFAAEPNDVRASVIWMHGLGATNRDFEPLLPAIGLPNVRFVFPQAPTRKVTINAGFPMPAWYDILTLEATGVRESDSDILRSTEEISDLVLRERERGLPAEKIVLAGFSQGGAIALHTGMRYPETLGGIMVLSAYEVRKETRDTEQSEANRNTSALVCHGTQDPVVPFAWGKAVCERLKESPEREVEWKSYPMEHQMCPSQVEDIAKWLRTRIG